MQQLHNRSMQSTSFLLYFTLTLKLWVHYTYRQISNISRILIGNKIVDHSDVVRASPLGAVQLHHHSRLNTWLQWIGQKTIARRDEKHLSLGFGESYTRGLMVYVDPHFIISMPADAPVPSGAWPSADAIVSTEVDMFSSQVLGL